MSNPNCRTGSPGCNCVLVERACNGERFAPLVPSVQILGSTYYVNVVATADDACGESNAPARTIKIDPGFPVDTQIETFYHEVTHILLEQLGLNKLLTDAQDELFAQSLGMALAQLVQNNNLPGARK